MSFFSFQESYFKSKTSVFSGNYHFSRVHEQWARWIMSRYAPTNVLDVCCGYGFFLKAFDELGVVTIGVDISHHAIEAARSITRASLFQRDLERESIPCETGSVDVTFFVNSLEYFRDAQRIFSEIRRVLRPGGVLFFSDVNGGLLSRILNRNVQDRIACWHMRTPQQVKRVLKKARFLVTDSFPNGGPIEACSKIIPWFLQKVFKGYACAVEPGYFMTFLARAI
ncbi:MAG TPA: class I SAM-dependent methyltransferase [Candidatus Lokiarchaeia archaeon]|nr:class I SAM-dependent methyltransferase [Candidatus Lokiarchaeia archaeon]